MLSLCWNSYQTAVETVGTAVETAVKTVITAFT